MGQLRVTALDNRCIVVIGNLFTKYIEAVVVPSIEASINAQGFLDNIIFRQRPQRRFLTHRGSNFTSKLVKEVCNIISISKVVTSSYHPQCDWFIERTNEIATQIIAMHVSSNLKDWDTCPQPAVYAHNTSLSETTGDTPSFLTYGREPIKLPDFSLLPSSCLSRSDNHHREGMINQIRIARTHAAEYIYTA